MDTANIEKLDRRRYTLLLWDTVCFGLLGCVLVSLIFLPEGLLTVPTSVMVFLVAVSGIINGKCKQIDARMIGDPALYGALNNEMILFYRHKAIRWSFYTVMAVSAIAALVSLWVEFSAFAACIAVIYTGLLSWRVFRLVFLK